MAATCVAVSRRSLSMPPGYSLGGHEGTADHPRLPLARACHAQYMTRGIRALAAIGVGFIVWRIGAELMVLPASLLLGVVAGAVTWALSGPRVKSNS